LRELENRGLIYLKGPFNLLVDFSWDIFQQVPVTILFFQVPQKFFGYCIGILPGSIEIMVKPVSDRKL
jgi:hypothetical protein